MALADEGSFRLNFPLMSIGVPYWALVFRALQQHDVCPGQAGAKFVFHNAVDGAFGLGVRWTPCQPSHKEEQEEAEHAGPPSARFGRSFFSHCSIILKVSVSCLFLSRGRSEPL